MEQRTHWRTIDDPERLIFRAADGAQTEPDAIIDPDKGLVSISHDLPRDKAIELAFQAGRYVEGGVPEGDYQFE